MMQNFLKYVILVVLRCAFPEVKDQLPTFFGAAMGSCPEIEVREEGLASVFN